MGNFNRFNRNNRPGEEEPKVTRAKLPRENQFIGKVMQRYGGNKMLIKCSDGKERNSRVPGRLRRGLWIREGDIVIVELWEFDKNRADILFKYKPAEIAWLKNNGYLKEENLSGF